MLGFAGLIPFVLLTLACWLVSTDWLHEFMRSTGLPHCGVALSWWYSLGDSGAAPICRLVAPSAHWPGGVLPTIIAWFSTMVGGFGFALLMAGFIAAYQVDKRLFTWYGLPIWFIELRFKLTCVAVAALMLTLISGNVRG